MISRTEKDVPKYITHLSGDWINEVAKLKEQKRKGIWVVGDGEIVSKLINHQLLDEIIITYIPVLLREGKPLYSNLQEQLTWKATKTICFKSGVIQVVFQLNK